MSTTQNYNTVALVLIQQKILTLICITSNKMSCIQRKLLHVGN